MFFLHIFPKKKTFLSNLQFNVDHNLNRSKQLISVQDNQTRFFSRADEKYL